MDAQVLGLIGNLGSGEALVILVIGLLVFGRRLPEVSRGIGRAVFEFRKGLEDVRDRTVAVYDDPKPSSRPSASPVESAGALPDSTAPQASEELPVELAGGIDPFRPSAPVAQDGSDLRVARPRPGGFFADSEAARDEKPPNEGAPNAR